MSNFSATHYIFYATTGQPDSGLLGATANSATGTVVDSNNDGNLDSGEFFVASDVQSYTGYTVTIGGLTYAVFGSGNSYYIPYDSSVSTPSTDTSTWSFAAVAENAVVVNCFLSGTMITIDTGEIAVESLKIGDEIVTADGKTVKIKWVARQDVLTTFGPAKRLMPVRFA
ncbi:Hint domain-containing protein, partial [Nioella ostreopsis]|uniref:Hint domain-containing protein n=1 Tax=Nioella ostreopsis TaxID=2448479 RepID=UPI001980E97B